MPSCCRDNNIHLMRLRPPRAHGHRLRERGTHDAKFGNHVSSISEETMFHFSPSATEQPSMINGDPSDLGTASACRKGTREGQWRRQQRTSTSGQWQRKRRAATRVKRPASLSATPFSAAAPGDGREPATARAGGKASAGAWRRCRSEARSVEQPPPTEREERTGGAGGGVGGRRLVGEGEEIGPVWYVTWWIGYEYTVYTPVFELLCARASVWKWGLPAEPSLGPQLSCPLEVP